MCVSGALGDSLVLLCVPLFVAVTVPAMAMPSPDSTRPRRRSRRQSTVSYCVDGRDGRDGDRYAVGERGDGHTISQSAASDH